MDRRWMAIRRATTRSLQKAPLCDSPGITIGLVCLTNYLSGKRKKISSMNKFCYLLTDVT